MLSESTLFIPPAPWVLDEDGPEVTFYVRRHTVIKTVQIVLHRHEHAAAAHGLDTPTNNNSNNSVITSTSPLRHSSNNSDEAICECALWCTVVPSKARRSADAVYRAHPPFVLGSFAVRQHSDSVDKETRTVLTVPVPHCEVAAGSTVRLSFEVNEPSSSLAAATSPASTSYDAMEVSSMGEHLFPNSDRHDRRRAHSNSSSPNCASAPGADTLLDTQATINTFASVRFHLSGLSDGLSLIPDMCEWRALLCHRWYELRSHVREATILEPSTRRYACQQGREGLHESGCQSSPATEPTESEMAHGTRSDASARARRQHRARYHSSARQCNHSLLDEDDDANGDDDGDHTVHASGTARVVPLYSGEVREAVALSTNGAFVRWVDGSMSPMDELRPYRRLFAPARADKTVRVRRYPHRYADVVGTIPYSTTVEAFGLRVDEYTGERYACVYVPLSACTAERSKEYQSRLVSSYDLATVTTLPHRRASDPAAENRTHHRHPHPCSPQPEERFVWGWTKIAGAGGHVFLVEVAAHDNTYDTHGDADTAQPQKIRRKSNSISSESTTSSSVCLASSPIMRPAAVYEWPHSENNANTLHARSHGTAARVGDRRDDEHAEKSGARRPHSKQPRRGDDVEHKTHTKANKRGRDTGATLCDHAESRSSKLEAVRTEVLPPGRYYIPVHPGKTVRVRARADAKSRTLGRLETNELREAHALLYVPVQLTVQNKSTKTDEAILTGETVGPSSSSLLQASTMSKPAAESMSNTARIVYHEYVEWKDEKGYSMVRDDLNTYLAPIDLHQGIRRFPVRSRIGTKKHTDASGSAYYGCTERTQGAANTTDSDHDKHAECGVDSTCVQLTTLMHDDVINLDEIRALRRSGRSLIQRMQ